MNISTVIATLIILNISAANAYTDNVKKNTILAERIIKEAVGIHQSDNKLSIGDLHQFAESIKDKRIIALGEQTHGAGSVFELKTNLIKYLHKNHGFDLLILESGMFDVAELWHKAKEGKSIKDAAPGNIFYMYSKSKEVLPLFDYVNEQANSNNPLTLVGFDSQHTGEISNNNLVKDLTIAVQKLANKNTDSKQWRNFTKQLQGVLNVESKRLDKEAETAFFERLSGLQTGFLNAKHLSKSIYWHRITKGLEAQAKRQWGIIDTRSEEMGLNVKYWADKYPDKKIIIWAHTWHLARKGLNQINAGQVLSDSFKDDYFMIHFTASTGHYTDFIDMKTKKVSPLTDNAIESLLSKQTKAAINFVNIRALLSSERGLVSNDESDMKMFVNDYSQTLTAQDWATYFDGVFYLKNSKAASYTP